MQASISSTVSYSANPRWRLKAVSPPPSPLADLEVKKLHTRLRQSGGEKAELEGQVPLSVYTHQWSSLGVYRWLRRGGAGPPAFRRQGVSEGRWAISLHQC